MELKIIKDEKDMMQVELVGESTTFANLLKDELYEDKSVTSAAFLVEHPLVSNPRIIVRTKGKTPKKALKDAAARIEKKAADFETQFKKAK